MGWREEGVTLRLYVSTSGDFVSLGERTDYPFVPGGPGGLPMGMGLYAPNGTAGISLTTSSLGRVSISNASTTDPHTNIMVGVNKNVFVDPGYRYIMAVQCQVMEGKAMAYRDVDQALMSGGHWGTTLPAVSPWEDITLYGEFMTNSTSMALRMSVVNYNPAEMNWGVQWQNLSLTKLPQNPPVPVWKEITCEVRNLQTRSGREKVTNRYEVGSASIGILNDGGEFTYRDPHPFGLRPGRFVKVEAQVAGYSGTYPVYYGIIDGFTDSYTLDGHALAVIQCQDISSLLSNMTVPSMSAPTTIVYSGSRWIQVLNGVGWHPKQTTYSAGQFGQQGIVNNGRTVRDELGLIADSEGSYFFADRSGYLVYRDRTWPTWEANGNTVQAELLAQPEPEPVTTQAVQFKYPGISGNYMSTPHQTALNAATDLEITARMSTLTWTVGGIVVGKTDAATYSWYLQQAGAVAPARNMVARVGGTTVNGLSFPYANNQTFWVRIRYVQATGLVQWFHAADSATEPTTWTQLGTDRVISTVGNAVSTGPVTVGAVHDGTIPFGGRVAHVIVRGAGGAIVFQTSEADVAKTPGALAYTSVSGHPMTVHQTGSNVIVQNASTIKYLPDVDTIPTDPGAPIVCTQELHTSWDRARVVNEVSLANQGGSAITRVDDASQKKYGPRTYQRMDLLNDNAHPEYIDTRMSDLLDGYTDAVLRVNTVRFRPTGLDSVRWALRTFLNDLVRVRYAHPTEGWGYAVVSHIQGLTHSFSNTEWSVDLNLDDPESFVYFIEGSAVTGWDTGLWDEDIWDGAGTPDTPAFWNARYGWSSPSSKWG